MKKALIHFYGDAVINCDSLAEGLAIVEKLIKVESKGYGRERKVIEAEDSTFDFELISDGQFIRRADEDNMMQYLRDKVDELQKEFDRVNSERWKFSNEKDKANQEIECLKKEISIIRSVKEPEPEEQGTDG